MNYNYEEDSYKIARNVQFLNINENGKLTNDCAKRAIGLAYDMPYREVKIQLNRYKKISNTPKFNSTKNLKEYMLNVMKTEYFSYPAKKGIKRMTGNSFCESHSEGRYILNMANHLTCCIYGVIYDTWDCSDKCVYGAYEITELYSQKYLQKNNITKGE